MKKTIKRSGFTIVELVIVIAVIAVLAGVLIPTFGGIIERANYSNDNQIVANINKVLVVEDIITGREPNDVVEIQKYIKENGLSLKTKSEDNYIWYNIEKNQVFLAKLDLSGTNPALVTSEETIPVEFNSELTAPEAFISGYLFLSEEADGDLAKCIWTLRNPESKQDLIDSLTKIQGLENGSGLHSLLSTLMNRTAVMTEADTFYMGDDGSAVTRIIVSSEMTTVTENSVKNLKTRFPRVIVVDFHSGVVEMEDGAKAVISGVTDEDKMFFVYISDEIKTKYDTNPNIKYLITTDERGDEITSVELIYIDKTGNEIGTGTLPLTEFIKSEYKFTSNYPFQPDHKNGTTYYGFSHYSLRKDGTKDFDTDVSKEYILNEDEKLLIDSNKAFYIYAVFEEDHEDFQIGSLKYSSRYMTYMLANNSIGKLPDGTNTITVITTTATLGNETYKDLTLPADVELLVPTVNYNVVEETNKDGNKTGNLILGDALNNYGKFQKTLIKGSYSAINKNNVAGQTKLTIKSGVTLTVSAHETDPDKNASIYVDAVLQYAGTRYQCYINDKCGVLEVESDAKIDSNGNITAYGIIRGNGEIVASSGTVSEIMTILDWYGGSNAAVAVGASDLESLGGVLGLDISGKKVVPFNEWKADNIRLKNLKIGAAAAYKAETGIFLEGVVFTDFILANNDSTNSDLSKRPLFLLGEGAFIEKSISNDGDIKLTINGNVSDTNKTMVLTGIVKGLGTATIDFSNIAIPLSHFDVHVATGSTLTVSNNIFKVLPGSDIVIDGTLNIQGNAKVVICNEYDIKFKAKSSTTTDTGITNLTTRYVCSFTVSADGKTMNLSSQKQKYTMKNWKLDWYDDGSPKTLSVTVPYTYPVTTSATFVVNGELNFSGNALFAGEITSENEGAQINTTGTVGGHVIPEGWYIQKNENNFWYETYADGLYSKPIINADEDTVLNGTYTYNGSIWQK